MNIRLVYPDGRTRDVDNVRDSAKSIQVVKIGERLINLVSDVGGDVELTRTDEVQDGRVVFR